MKEFNLTNKNKGVLLVNLGTPESPKLKDVKSFLKEMLSDKHIISGSALKRSFLVNFIILPSRASKSASSYKKIWTSEGSPLRVTMNKIAHTLSSDLSLTVLTAMRYGKPSLESAFKEFKEKDINNILIIPFYPHSTLSTHITLTEEIARVSESFPSVKYKIETPLALNPNYIDCISSGIKDFMQYEIVEEVEETEEPAEIKIENVKEQSDTDKSQKEQITKETEFSFQDNINTQNTTVSENNDIKRSEVKEPSLFSTKLTVKEQNSYILFHDHFTHHEAEKTAQEDISDNNDVKNEVLDNSENNTSDTEIKSESFIQQSSSKPETNLTTEQTPSSEHISSIGNTIIADNIQKIEDETGLGSISEEIKQEEPEEIKQEVPEEIKQEEPEEIKQEESEVQIKKRIVQIKRTEEKSFDHTVFSFHGIPVSHIHTVAGHKECCFDESCKIKGLNYKCEKTCYWKQCHNTANAIAKKLNLKEKDYTIAFQSRLGKTPWIGPDLNTTLTKLAKSGTKSLLIVPVSFPVDCIETIFELNETAKDYFISKGGNSYDVVPALNTNENWIKALCSMIEKW